MAGLEYSGEVGVNVDQERMFFVGLGFRLLDVALSNYQLHKKRRNYMDYMR